MIPEKINEEKSIVFKNNYCSMVNIQISYTNEKLTNDANITYQWI